MVERIGLGKSRCGLLSLLGLGLLACSAIHHDCFEMRDCAGPKGFIEAGPNDDWWDPGGAAGEAQFVSTADAGSAGQPRPVALATSDGGSAGAAGANSAADNEPLRVVSVTPADGALGVRSNDKLVIRFSQPMLKDSVETAYRSSDLPSPVVTFAWSDDFTALTVSPSAPLLYASGNAQADGSVELAAKTYHYGFADGALASAGRALPELTFSFSTLRQVSAVSSTDPRLTGNWTDGEGEGIHNCLRNAQTPYTPSVCVGDDANNVRYTGFVSFDLSSFPDDIAEFLSARLQASALVYGAPESLGDSSLEHVFFAQLDQAALSTAAISTLGPFYNGASVPNDTYLVLNEDLTGSVADDYANRVARSNHSQYRLRFAKVLANFGWDDVELSTANIRLATTYLIP
jgi:Bacterial Ig-like domain